MKLTSKQKEIFNCFRYEKPKILVCHGAKRAGKTFILIFTFLTHIAKFKGMGLSFILGGVTQSSLRRNVLDDMEKIIGKELKLDKSGAVHIFGNKVYCFDGANSDAWKKPRGFTAAGAFLNEGTALHDAFIKECISRCSYPGAVVFIDTNPDKPTHPIKKDYVDKDGELLPSGKVNVRSFHFSLFDNDTLDKDYIDSIVANTPSGMFFERDVKGAWVAAAGIVYPDFDRNVHYINKEQVPDIARHFVGVDFGWEHPGVFVLLGDGIDGNLYLLKEWSAKHRSINNWIKIGQELADKYGYINFYCDSARPDLIYEMRKAGLRAVKAIKDVTAGIAEVATLYKTRHLFVVRDEVSLFDEEIDTYAWKEGEDEPVKEMDDVMDAVRYGIYSNKKYGERGD